MVSNRSDCSKHQIRKSKKTRAKAEIPNCIQNLFKAFRLEFPENGTVIVSPSGEKKILISVNGKKTSQRWTVNKEHILEFKDGQCVSAS